MVKSYKKIIFLICYLLTLSSYFARAEDSESYLLPDKDSPHEEVEKTLESFSKDILKMQKEVDLPLEKAPEIILEHKNSYLSKILILGHEKDLKDYLLKMVNRLSLPGDHPVYEIRFSANPVPNAEASLHGSSLEINIGLLAKAKDEDEFASVVAHELTHTNEKVLETNPDFKEISEIMNELPEIKNLKPKMREEIRADLGSVLRMIKGEYNPYGAYRVQRTFQEVYKKMEGPGFVKRIYQKIFEKSREFYSTHPKGEIRMSAIKAFILHMAGKKDLSKIVAKENAFPLSISLLRRRAQIWSLPVDPVVTKRAAYLIGGYRALEAIVETDVIKNPAVHGALEKGLGGVNEILRLLSHFHVTDAAIDIGVASVTTAGVLGVGKAIISKSSKRNLKGQVVEEINNILEKYRAAQKMPMKEKLKALQEVFFELDVSVDNLKYYKRTSGKIDNWYYGFKELIERARQTEVDILYEISDGLKTFKNKKLLTKDLLTDDQTKRTKRSLLLFNESPDLNYDSKTLFQEKPEALKIIEDINGIGEYSKAELTEAFDDIPLEERRTLKDFSKALQILDNLEEYGDQAEQLHFLYRWSDGLDLQVSNYFLENYEKYADYIFIKKRSSPFINNKFRSLTQRALRSYAQVDRKSYDLMIKKVLDLKKLTANLDVSQKLAALDTIRFTVDLNYKEEIKISNEIYKHLKSKITSLTQGFNLISKELEPLGFSIKDNGNTLRKLLLDDPKLIQTKEDLAAIVRSDFLLSRADISEMKIDVIGDMNLSVREKIFRKYYKNISKFRKFIYEPETTEIIHRFYLERSKELGFYPKTLKERLEFWQEMTVFADSAESDSFLLKVLNDASSDELHEIISSGKLSNAYGLKVQDSNLRLKIIKNELDHDEEYLFFVKSKKERPSMNSAQRLAFIDKYVKKFEVDFPEKGFAFQDLIEKLSTDIHSSESESAYLKKILFHNTGEQSEDAGLRVLSEVLDESLSWSKDEQFGLLLFLRGDQAASKQVKEAMGKLGTGRVRQIFNQLPTNAKTILMDSFLDSPKGLLVNEGFITKAGKRSIDYEKAIIDYLLRFESGESLKVGKEVLGSLMYAVKKTGNEPMKSYILAYLLSIPKSSEGKGRVLTEVFKAFGGTGVKIGQNIGAAEVLPEEETIALRELQANALKPTREEIYSDLRKILNVEELPFEVEDLLGSASMKYAVLAKDLRTGKKVVLKVLREHAIAHTNQEIALLEVMAEDLRNKYGTKYGIFKNIVRTSKEAVLKELNLQNEVKNSEVALNKMYLHDSNFKPPKEVLVNDRLIVAEYVEGTSIHNLEPQDQAQSAEQILNSESKIYFSDEDVFFIDPDRHPGNYRALKDIQGKISTRPIDFGQLLKISKNQRDEMVSLFGISQIIKQKTGPTEWSAKEIAKILGRQGDREFEKKLLKNMKEYLKFKDFPEMKEVTAYYLLLSSIDDSGVKLGIEYTDYIRGLILLKQYQTVLEKAGKKIENLPSEIFADIVKIDAVARGEEIKLTTLEKVKIAVHSPEVPSAGIIKCLRMLLNVKLSHIP